MCAPGVLPGGPSGTGLRPPYTVTKEGSELEDADADTDSH